jgi:hypothetical protein
MKVKRINGLTMNILLGVLIAMLILSFYSCATKAKFLNSSVAPAARGTVKVTKDNNNNNVIKIAIYNLSEPDRLDPPKQFYVVWMVTEQDNLTKNIGQITTSSGLLSKNLKASFETVSSFKPTRIFITAENEANVQYPGWPEILSTNNF